MTKILGIDFETQGQDALTTNITEVGAVLKDLSTGLESVLSRFCFEPHYPPQTDEIVELTGITDVLLKQYGASRKEIFEKHLFPMVEEADYVVAHNKRFDETVFDVTCERLNLNPPEKQWICTLTEVPYPRKYTCKKLSHLAYDHGILVDPTTLHRASQDVALMLALVGKYAFEDILAYANAPWVYLQALIPPPWEDHGVGKAKAQKLGFNWERAKGCERVFPKAWIKRVKNSELTLEKYLAESVGLNFKVL